MRPRPSRLFIYYCERMIEGSLGQGDTGAFGRDGFKAAARYGYVREAAEWPYDITRYANDPPPPVWSDALQNVLRKPYKAVDRSVEAMKAVLSNKQTMAFGFSVYESFESAEVASTGVVPMRTRRSGCSAGTRCSQSATSRIIRIMPFAVTAGAYRGGSPDTS